LSSNRESGYGRFDICIEPKDPKNVGTIIEVKAVDLVKDETVMQHGLDALKQIDDKKYDTDMRRRGVTRIAKYAIIFNNAGERKRVYVYSTADKE